MGSVAMGTGGSYPFEGYIVTEIAYCLYCDKCGSFNITCPMHLPKWAGFFLLLLVIGTAGVASRDTYDKCGTFALVGVAAISLWRFSSDGFKHRYHICRKCGNTDITRSNVLNYPADDRSVLDVPYDMTIRYYVEN